MESCHTDTQPDSLLATLEREYVVTESNLKATFREVDFLSTTADIWTVNNKSSLGILVQFSGTTRSPVTC